MVVRSRPWTRRDDNTLCVPLGWKRLLASELLFLYTEADRAPIPYRVSGAEPLARNRSLVTVWPLGYLPVVPPTAPAPPIVARFENCDVGDLDNLYFRSPRSHQQLLSEATHWNERYSTHGRVPLQDPNDFVRGELERLPNASRILFLGEGEGRNAIWAALRHLVTMVELTAAGCETARTRASTLGRSISVRCADSIRWLEGIENSAWDAVSMSYVRIPSAEEESWFGHLIRDALRPGGVFFGEFSQKVTQPESVQRMVQLSQCSEYVVERDGLMRVQIRALR